MAKNPELTPRTSEDDRRDRHRQEKPYFGYLSLNSSVNVAQAYHGLKHRNDVMTWRHGGARRYHLQSKQWNIPIPQMDFMYYVRHAE